jgi:uncharacterized membrane protein YdbT with pleckstrin-like domain
MAVMPPEEQLWEGAPSLKILTFDLAWAVLFCVALSLAIYLGYDPALRAISGISKEVAHAVAGNEPGIRLAVILFVVVVAGGRIARLLVRALSLRSQSYRLSNQRLLIERGVLSRTIDEIDLRTVEDITFHQSFGERLLGLGQIGIVSSEALGQGFGARAHLRASLVAVADARAAREQIRNAAYAASGKQIFMRPT